MNMTAPAWTAFLDEDDWQFVRRFLLASGSLKALAAEYGISYPTVRNRMDRLIGKVQAATEPAADDVFHQQVRVFVAEGRMERGMARRLLELHRQTLKTLSAREPGGTMGGDAT